MPKTVEEYMNLLYAKTITPINENEGGGFLVEVPDLGRSATCAWGATEEEALHNLKQVMKSNIEMWLKEGLDIPEPKIKKNYSGAIALRLPRYMHAFLAEFATNEGLSINALINNCIAEKMGIQKESNASKAMHHYHYHEHQIASSQDVSALKAKAQEKSCYVSSDEKIFGEYAAKVA